MKAVKIWVTLVMTTCGIFNHFASGARNFVTNAETVPLYGVYEVAIRLDSLPEDPVLPGYSCVFESEGKEPYQVRVDCFGTGDGKIRARAYVNALGKWSWRIVESADEKKVISGGTFIVSPSALRGRLLPDSRNPRHWMTESGDWFLNLNDTAYFLLSPVDNSGAPVNDEQAMEYVRDAMKHGITSFRSFPPQGSLRLGSHLQGEIAYLNSVYGDHEFREPNLANYATVDTRMQMLLDTFPDACMQFIVLPLGSAWGEDEPFWYKIPEEKRKRLLQYVIARFAAFPQIFWLVENDAHYGEKFPLNNAVAREVGQYLQANDPWQHPRSTGPARGGKFIFAEESWATYIHLERRYDLNAEAVADYQHIEKPVFLGEDYYEQDREVSNPDHMQYFQRRLFWAWLFSGASANYGSRWSYVHPYSQTGVLKGDCLWPYIVGGEGKIQNRMPDYTEQLRGLDSVRFIPDFLKDRNLQLSSFMPDADNIRDLSAGDVDAPPKLMRKGVEAWLVYHPNALENGKSARANPDASASFEVDLPDGQGEVYSVEWFNCETGESLAMEEGVPGGRKCTFTAPWKGTDVVLYLKR